MILVMDLFGNIVEKVMNGSKDATIKSAVRGLL